MCVFVCKIKIRLWDVLCACKWKIRDCVLKSRLGLVFVDRANLNCTLSFNVWINVRYWICVGIASFFVCINQVRDSVFVDERRNFFDMHRSILCTSLYAKPQTNFVSYKTKMILKYAVTMSVKPPVIYLGELWTVFDSTRQGHAVGFCVWMMAAMNRHVSYPTYNVLTRCVLKRHKSSVQIGIWHTLYWNVHS